MEYHGWKMIQDGILTPDLGEEWVCVKRSQVHTRQDRPHVPIPQLSVYEIPMSQFEKTQYKYKMRDFGCIDFETWRDFDRPNMVSFLFYKKCFKWDESKSELWNLSREYLRQGMKIKPLSDGTIPRNANGWPVHWERDYTKWRKGAPKPKGYGSHRKGESNTVQVSVGWLWDDEFAEHWPRLCEQTGIHRIYAHNATVDIIAALSRLKPDLEHPLLYFLSDKKDEETRILFKGSSILTSSWDLANFFEDENYSRGGWDYKKKQTKIIEDYDVEIRDSLALLTIGLGQLGAAIGYEKTETPEIFTNDLHPDFGNYMAIEPDHVRYAVDDCVILWRSLLELWNICKELGYHGQDIPLTIGALGFQMIAHSLKDTHLVKKRKNSWKYQTVHNREDLDSILRECLVGGMVRVFDDTPCEEPSCGIDARAHYPSVEKTNTRWPDWTKLQAINHDENALDYIYEKEGGIHVHWKRPESDEIGCVASRDPKTGNLVWTEYEGTRWITMLEARWLIERGYELTPVPYVYERTLAVYDSETGETHGSSEANAICAIVCPTLDLTEYGIDNPFFEVERWFNYRLELRKKGDPRQALVKILMNAGSFGKWVELNQDVRIATLSDAHYEFGDWEFSAVQEYGGEMVGYVKDPILKRAKNSAMILGAYITGAARIALIEMGDHFGAENLLYTDTDSWKVRLSVDEMRARVPPEMLGRDLGQWAIENEHDFFHALKPKQYKVHFISKEDSKTGELVPCDIWKLRIKGVNVRGVIQKMWRDEFIFGRPTDDFTLAALKELQLGDRMVYDRLIGIRESLRKGTRAGAWMAQSKQLRQS